MKYPSKRVAMDYLTLALQMPPDDAEALERAVLRHIATGLARRGAERKAVGEWAKAPKVAK